MVHTFRLATRSNSSCRSSGNVCIISHTFQWIHCSRCWCPIWVHQMPPNPHSTMQCVESDHNYEAVTLNGANTVRESHAAMCSVSSQWCNSLSKILALLLAEMHTLFPRTRCEFLPCAPTCQLSNGSVCVYLCGSSNVLVCAGVQMIPIQ